ncbi:hypothetical protein DM860_014566 [Cuscuta australis]|uniref:Uncharacterized protein n=1 Tax=Cuscuta australis TaxID=267555 RepID=A0A328DI83_9ASTE|nr:hypothetical protein DM860_014566 [Cuscuta australis]
MDCHQHGQRVGTISGSNGIALKWTEWKKKKKRTSCEISFYGWESWDVSGSREVAVGIELRREIWRLWMLLLSAHRLKHV